MMKAGVPIIILAALLILFILANLFIFIVDETEQAVVLKFGKPVKVVLGDMDDELIKRASAEIEEYGEKTNSRISIRKGPGLYFKLPFIQVVEKFEDRVLEYDSNPKPSTTKDKKQLLVNNFARWRIYNPLRFRQTVLNERGAQSRLDDLIYSFIKSELGKNNLIEIIRTTNRKIESPELGDDFAAHIEPITVGRAEIMNRVLMQSREGAREYGIEIIDVRIKKADLPAENMKSIFGRMNAERNRIATKYEEEGKREATKIMAETDRDVRVLLATAQMESQRVRGEGDAEALKIYAEGFVVTEEGPRKGTTVLGYQADPEFYKYVRSLETLSKSVDDKAEFIMSTENELFRYLNSGK